MKNFLVAISALCFGIAELSHAALIDSDYLIQIRQFTGADFSTGYANAYSNYSNNSTFSNTYEDGVEAYGNLTTGEVGSASKPLEGYYQSIVEVFDVLTFDTATDVSFSFLFEGLLSSTSNFDITYGQGRIDIYDITGLDGWLESEALFGSFDQNSQISIVDAAIDVSINTVSIDMDSVDGFSTGTGDFSVSNPLVRDGTFHEVFWEINNSFTVDPEKVYGISLSANTFGSDGVGMSDFLNTGTFSFTDLGGATFDSASGLFLSSQVTTVPEPSSIALFALGVLGLFGSRLKRNFV